jgi:phage FluMu protein Com
MSLRIALPDALKPLPLPADFKVICSTCGESLVAAVNFSAGQLKKKHPRCRACAPNKFSNRSTGAHQSRRESRRAQDLANLQRAGLISELREQVIFELVPAQKDESGRVVERALTYIADFVYKDPTTKVHVEDAKGCRTKEYRIKRKLMLWIHRIRIEEV